MTLTDNLELFANTVGDEVKRVRTLMGVTNNTLNGLTTTNKTNLVAAINEIKSIVSSAGGGSANINDNLTTTLTTWSSAKIINTLDMALDAIVGAAPADLNTLEAMALAINNDPSFHTYVTSQLSYKIGFDEADQGLTNGQKTNVRLAIGAAGAEEVGDTTTNFVTTFNQGLI